MAMKRATSRSSPAGLMSLLLLLGQVASVIGGPSSPAAVQRRRQQQDVTLLGKRQNLECGPGIGSCDPGECCSESGFCGSTTAYCGGSGCQLDYSDSCDTFFGPPGPSTESVPRPKIGNVPYGSIIRDCISPEMIALSFDDGPYLYTTQMLDVLDELQVKATFFVAGNNRGKGRIDDEANGWAAMLRRMHASGHHIASHTWTHRDLNRVNSTIRRTEMVYNEMAFRNLFGWFPTYMRPPYLECSVSSGCAGLMDELGYHIVNVNIDTKDFEFNSPALIQQAKDRYSAGVSTNAVANDYIILAHDVQYQTVVNLTAYMVTTARDRGYRLVTVGECLGDPVENWYRTVPGVSTPTCSTSVRASSTTSLSSLSSSTRSSTSRAPSPTPSNPVIISPDQRCGGDTGYTCMGSAFGNCCSHYGYW
ncbi:hypothetical protein B0I35DRAFT_46757 [Stachybotrys elegans]|uniref:NodB homology domain-containing protein n=1 Tax=Stachybotrys elegans TaxID=80388 RepID=A0A8K0T989_9HYPO|nr:hypothetical protein B0I35DRAFT_46757 [Stachybotrys elegans]